MNWLIKQAVYSLNRGGIIAYPTESVYGLGCDPFDEFAVDQLLWIKQREWQKGLILIASAYEQVSHLLEPLPLEIQQRVFNTWPGPVTWLLPAKPSVPYWLRGDSYKLAIRITAHPLAAYLCECWNGPLVSTSANITGKRAAKSAFQVRRIFGQQLDYILPGAVGGRARPSDIRDALTGQIIRI